MGVSSSGENCRVDTVTYHAIFERAGDGTIWGYSPEVPGALGAGGDLEEARESLRKGIEIWIEFAKEQGDPIPPSTAVVAFESIAVRTA